MSKTPKPLAPSSAIVPPPPQKTAFKSLVGLETRAEQPIVNDNMKKTNWADLNFKVDPEFKVEFKTVAASHGLSMKELLEEAYDLWKKNKAAK
jgi:hypothetical protein